MPVRAKPEENLSLAQLHNKLDLSEPGELLPVIFYVSVIMWGIMKHRKGTKYEDDYLVIDWKYHKTLKYKYKESAEHMRNMLAEKYQDCKFTVVMLDE